MATQTVINKQDPEIEAYRLGLLEDTQGLVRDTIFGGNVQKLREQGLSDEQIAEQLGRPVEDVGAITADQVFSPPDYQVADLSEGETEAIRLAKEGIGSYQDFIDSGQETLKDASTMISGAATGIGEAGQQAFDAAQAGIGQFAGTTGGFDPSGIGSFMNQFEDAAVQQALADISEAGERKRSQIGADAAAAGAFGSRRQLREGMLDENILKEQGRTAAAMRQAGYESAARRAQQAFEDEQRRGQAAGMGIGQLGLSAAKTDLAANQGIGVRESQLANVGMNFGQLGGMQTQLSAADIDKLLTTGGLQRLTDQKGLDAVRLTDLQNYSQPFQLYGFQSDIYSGVPTGSSTMQVASMPQTNPYQTAVGLGIGAYGAATGAQQAGLF
jgi:hypothetical protein